MVGGIICMSPAYSDKKLIVLDRGRVENRGPINSKGRAIIALHKGVWALLDFLGGVALCCVGTVKIAHNTCGWDLFSGAGGQEESHLGFSSAVLFSSTT